MTKVVFIGSKLLGLKCLEKINALRSDTVAHIVTLDDREDCRTVLPEFRSFAAEAGLPITVAKTRKESERAIAKLRPDLCLVVCWYWLISPETLKGASREFICLHNSILPRYRGAAPLVWAMINGEPEVGITLFSMTDRMDEGGVYGSRAVPVGREDYISDVLSKTQQAALSLLDEVWVRILDEKIRPVQQDGGKATYGTFRTPEDGQIDWTLPAERIYDFIRAQSSPYPGAFTFLPDDQKLSIWRACPIEMVYNGVPGQVASIGDGSALVVCGDRRLLRIEAATVNGKPHKLSSIKTRLGGKK